jgi:hypothetical protein
LNNFSLLLSAFIRITTLMTQITKVLLSWALFLSIFSAPAYSVEIKQGPSAVVAKEGVVIVSWTTDGICGTRLHYGRQPELLNQKEEGSIGLQHEVTLNDLQPAVTYHYRLGTAKKWLTSGTLTLSADGKVTLTAGTEDAQSITTTGPPNTPPAAKPESRPLPKLTPSTPAPVKPPAKAPPAVKTPPTAKTWGYMPSLQDHYERHGRDFNCTSADDYAAKAWMFLQYARRNNLPMKWDAADRTLRVWEPKTRAFAAYNANGTTKTFFRPNSDSYWSRQPGKPISANDLPF